MCYRGGSKLEQYAPKQLPPIRMIDSAERIRKRIFISYRHVEPDQNVALCLASELAKLHEVFIDTGFQGGQVWSDLINSALAEADFVIALLSQAGVGPDGDMIAGE